MTVSVAFNPTPTRSTFGCFATHSFYGQPVPGINGGAGGLLFAEDVAHAADLGADAAELLFDVLVAAVHVVDAVEDGLAIGDQRGQNQRSRGAQVGAHDGGGLQRRLAANGGGAAIDLMLAPMRISSCTCMKRFSKMFSVTMVVPSACVASAMYWACMSVGKPGYSSVEMSAALSVAAASGRGRCRVADVDA